MQTTKSSFHKLRNFLTANLRAFRLYTPQSVASIGFLYSGKPSSNRRKSNVGLLLFKVQLIYTTWKHGKRHWFNAEVVRIKGMLKLLRSTEKHSKFPPLSKLMLQDFCNVCDESRIRCVELYWRPNFMRRCSIRDSTGQQKWYKNIQIRRICQFHWNSSW